MATYSRWKKPRRRGSILLLAIFFLIALFSLAVLFFRILPAEFHSASQARRDVQSQYAGDAGVRDALTWLKSQPSHHIDESLIGAFNAANYADPGSDGRLDPDNAILASNALDSDWSYTSQIEVPRADFFRRLYAIRVVSYFQGKPVRETVSTVQNESFAKFALFFETWGPEFLFTMSPNGIKGPVHTNDFFRLVTPSSAFWSATKSDGSPQDAWVSGDLAEMTHAGQFRSSTLGNDGDGNLYYGGNHAGSDLGLVPFDGDGAPIAQRYDKIVEGGREKIRQIQEIPLPEDNENLREKTWGSALPSDTDLNALTKAKGPILVQTDVGEPNVGTGKVKGGIMIAGPNAVTEMQLGLTSEGHQRTRIRAGDTSIADPSADSAWMDVPRYQIQTTKDPEPIYSDVCVEEGTRQVPNMENYSCDIPKEGRNAGRCGVTERLVKGEGGVITTFTEANYCSWTERGTCQRQNGTKPQKYCIRSERRQTGTKTFPPTWTDVTEGTPGAVARGTTRITVPPGTPGSTTVAGSRTIQNWAAVVEVNEAEYAIPWKSGGVMVNGELVTNKDDNRLKVADGYTVTIKNDYNDSNGDYREYTVMEGRTNGVVYSDQHLYGVRGTNKGSFHADKNGNVDWRGRTIATNISKGRDIEIRDSILQYYDGDGTFVDSDGVTRNMNDGSNRLRPGASSPDHKHILGLIGRNIDLKPTGNSENYQNNRTNKRETGFNGGSLTGGLNVYAVLMAGVQNGTTNIGGFGAHSSAMEQKDKLGDFNLFGGIISANARRTQTGFSSGIAAGFRLNLNYDQIAAEFIEDFPTTNTYSVQRYVSYSRGSGFGNSL